MYIRTLSQLIDHLERAVERAEEAEWCALSLTADEADDLLPNLKQCLSVISEKYNSDEHLTPK
jgi:hypothetical protein